MKLESFQTLGLGLTATFREVRVCLWNYGRLRASNGFVSSGMHTQLLPFLESFLREEGYAFQDIDFVVVDTGPAESFTGLRLSLAFLKTWLLLSPDIQLYTTSSTQLIYEESLQKISQHNQRVVVVGLWGFQQRAYMQAFCEDTFLNPIRDVPLLNIPNYLANYVDPILVGNAFSHAPLDILDYEHFFIQGPNIEYAKQATPTDWRELSPKYYRKTTAEENL